MRIAPTYLLAALLFSLLAGKAPSAESGAMTASFCEQIEADWLLQEQYRHHSSATPVVVTTQADAAGGCDGVKDGRCGFHTDMAKKPWWQVDLKQEHAIDRVVVWNRCDGSTDRALHLHVLFSGDGRTWRTVYSHDGRLFRGVPDAKPLVVDLQDAEVNKARFIRIQLPGETYLHLDEVEAFGPEDPEKNLALHKPADQVSTSPWSTTNVVAEEPEIDLVRRTVEILSHAERLLDELLDAGVKPPANVSRGKFKSLWAKFEALPPEADNETIRSLYFEVRWIQRKMTLAHPILDFDAIGFAKRVPGSFNHMSDQYLGWWSRPGGGLHILRDFKGDSPGIECITEAFKAPGSFLRPVLSYHAEKVLFAWCRHYPDLAGEQNKLDKNNVPEDAFYHIFEMGIDGSGLRQLTHGKYDDFDARYLPDGRIVFLSTRRGQFIQCGKKSAQQTTSRKDLPDIYVRCGGGPERPCAVYTLHTMDGNGGNLFAISPFEMFEWTPSVASDGTILYSRWDYIDRYNMPYMSLWSINPDGTNARLVYGNYSRAPHCTFEPRSIPGSRKIIFTASAHHAQTMGSLVLLDPTKGNEGAIPIQRLTPEVVFPEIEGWPQASYANPWPLSERFYLVAWGSEGAMVSGTSGWSRWQSVLRPNNGTSLYLLDAEGNMELLHHDPTISSCSPMPIRSRKSPPMLAENVDRAGPMEGRFLVTDVYRGLRSTPQGAVKALRIVAVPPKTHPTMNYPSIGITLDDPGKCVFGTVPVEADGSAYFRVPAGVIVFFQALDADGKAIQTMRSTTHVQPGQTLSCIGCHENRSEAPRVQRVLAAGRSPSKITPGPVGSWPLRFDRLVQPVLEKHCVRCHRQGGEVPEAASFELIAEKAYESLTGYGKPSLQDHVRTRYGQSYSVEGAGAATQSAVLAKLAVSDGHHGVRLGPDDLERLIVWMDTYAQKAGSFGPEQERRLLQLKQENAHLFVKRNAEEPRELSD